jgi:hypothetical protein
MGLHQPVANWLLLPMFSGIDRDEGLTPIDPRHMIWGGTSTRPFLCHQSRPQRSCLFTSRAQNQHWSDHFYGNDIRFWLPEPLTVKMPYGTPPYGRHRYRNPIRHHQFGIYKRLRCRYGLVPKPKYKPNTPSNHMESSSTLTFIPKTRQE